MVKKIVLVYCVLFSFLQLGGCIGDDCGDFTVYSYRLISFDSEIIIFDFPSQQLQPWEGGSIPFESYAIHFESNTETISMVSPGLGNAVYACSPPEPFIETKLRSFKITSDKDYSQAYPAGTNLSPLFEMSAYDYGNIRWTIRADEWTNSDAPIPFQFLLYPEVPPSYESEFSFTIEFEFTGEGVDNLTVTTDPVLFTF